MQPTLATTTTNIHAEKDWSLVSKRTSPKPVDVLLIILPGIDRSEAKSFRTWAKNEGLVHHVRGNGERALTRQEFGAPVPGGLRRNAHVFINGHGEVEDNQHYLCIDETMNASEKSASLMESVRRIPRSGMAIDEALENNITVHVASCYSGILLKEVTPKTVMWSRGHFLAYGGEEKIDSKDALPFISASLTYLGKCKKNPRTYDPIKLFEELSKKRSDAFAIAGGTLSKALVAHSPRVLSDITQPLINLGATSDIRLLQYKNVCGSDKELKKLATIESDRLAASQTFFYPENEQIVRFLIRCIERNDIDALSAALQQYPDLISELDENGNSLLIWAISKSKNILEFLISRIPDVNIMGANGITALHRVAAKNLTDMVNLLAAENPQGSRADLNLQDMNGNTPLIHALYNNSAEAAIRLLELGANTNIANKRGETPLILAAKRGQGLLAAKILRTRPDVNATDANGKTALQLAVENGHVLLAEQLLKITENLAAIEAEKARQQNQMQPGANDH